MLADPARAARLQVEAADLTVDRLLGAGAAARRGALQPTKVDALMGILAGAPRLTLDGVAVVISEEEVRPVATLSDRTLTLTLSPLRGARRTRQAESSRWRSPPIRGCGRWSRGGLRCAMTTMGGRRCTGWWRRR